MPLRDPYPPAGDKPKPDVPPHLEYFFPEPSDQSEIGQFPWLRSDYDENIQSRLCYICRQVDFHYLSSNESPYDLNLGPYGDVKLRDCSFCRLAVDEPKIAIGSFRRKGLYDRDRVVLSSGWKHPRSNWRKSGQADILSSLVLRIWIYRHHGQGSSTGGYGIGAAYSVLHVVKDGSSHGAAPLSGRLVSPRYNSDAVRGWLQDCKISLPGERDKLDALNSIERFIDTQDECVVNTEELVKGNSSDASVKSDLDFAALSYVWGKLGQQNTLTIATSGDLHKKGSISTATDSKISKTIKDAMLICRDLGIRYLWVDALCIVQDDPDKMRQIKNMHHVYLNARLTIIAASGDHADEGLPGARSQSSAPRQTVLEIQNLMIIKESLDLDDRLATVYWGTRAWTFQEFLLSPRRLIFTKNALYFSCPHGVRSEDVVSPSHDSDFTYYGGLKRSGFEIQLREKLNWTTYAELASSFTARDLTNESDRMPAFLALSTVMANELFGGAPFVSGLPFAALDAALLWRRCLGCHICNNASRALERRGGFRHVPRDPIELPPSWSWAGWKGHAQYSEFILFDNNPSWSVVPRVNWLEASAKTGGSNAGARADPPPSQIHTWMPIKEINPEVWKQKYGGFTQGDADAIVYGHPMDGNEYVGRHLVHPTDGYLHLEAEVASFLVFGRLFDQMSTVQEVDDYILDGTVIYGARIGDPLSVFAPNSPAYCGVMYNDLDLSAIGITLPAEFSFIKLSQTTLQQTYRSSLPDALDQLTPGCGVRDCPEDKREMGPNKVNRYFSYDNYDCSNIWCLYNVMAVVWDGDVAFRVGIGKIHVDAFDKNPSMDKRQLWLG